MMNGRDTAYTIPENLRVLQSKGSTPEDLAGAPMWVA